MKKAFKLMTCALLGGTMLFAAACGGGDNPGGENNGKSETRPLALSINKPDGNFNPFFYTAQPDGQVISQTQASLLTADYNEKTNKIYPVAGEDYPTVAKDFRITYYDAKSGGNKSDSDKAADGGRTEYEFLLKKGMKYSDGKDLTIKDVLFNFYVYLDTAYTGSNTMYSVDIQGLAAYQQNDASLGIDGEGSNDQFILAAQGRMGTLIDFSNGDATLDDQGKADLAKVKSFYDEELKSDWNAIESSWAEDFKVNYTFTAAWQAYLFQEGLVEAQRANRPGQGSYEIRVTYNADGSYTKIDPDNKEAYNKGKILTTLDKYDASAIGHSDEAGRIDEKIQVIIEEIEQETTEEKVNAYIAKNGGDAENAKNELIKAYCISRVKSEYFSLDTQVGDILSFWATGSTAYNYFLADERGKAIKENEGTDKARNYISGIQTDKVTSFSSSIDGHDSKEYQLDGEYDVLKIIINNVDPAAIWQFGISVAPLHYYSGTYEGKDYVATFSGDANKGQGSGVDCFGVKRGSVDFFDKVISGQDTSKSSIPVGAGPYMASTKDGGVAKDGGQFLNNNIVYYERNTYFETMGTGLNNTKIKYLRYKVVDDDRIIPSVVDGSIDYGEPTGSTTNQTTVNGYVNSGKLTKYEYNTNGYGYVGINPTFVPDIEVRRIIMSVMQTDLATDFYGELAQPLYRPMSKTSWAYPENVGVYYGKDVAQIETKLTERGYRKNRDGVFEKDGHQLKYTFTIAGANTDHPAYMMFQEAAKILNQVGFSISVSNDSTALAKLAKGQLTVWAAAWSSGVDPDMYQLYHKDSNASSVLNWGYKTILNDNSGKYSEEKILINKISDLIEDGRKYLEDETRKGIYAKALDEIMNLAVELPVYQRKDLCIVNSTIIDVKTLNERPNATMGVIDRIWLIDYVK